MPTRALSDDQIENCFGVLAELRPHLQRDNFLATVRAMEEDGYKLVYMADQGRVVAVAGYRIYSNLFMGKHLYVDDLVTTEQARSGGYGKRLLSWLREQARAEACKVLHLDSGAQRPDAHKFYFREGMHIASFHFSQQLEQS
ncbi:GNAT family N-acetyltransferase [Gammaproteobacteria bacterium 53_120_T64]|nr:GNAT family N-acetyltransferase [Gammaproteobacteria bacterium 53_120_T64]